MARIEHSIGERFGRLVIASLNTRSCKSDPKKLEWKCKCDCGNEIFVRGTAMRSGKTKSCGCLARDLKQQSTKYKTSLNSTSGRLRSYRSWSSMKDRCQNPDNHAFKDYGARGITVCKSWSENFDNFFADMGERPEGLTLGRIDNDKGYAPDNCRWETWRQQLNNKRNTLFIGGKPLTEFCEEGGHDANLIRGRLGTGWDLNKALSEPVHIKNPKPPIPEDKYLTVFTENGWRIFCELPEAPSFLRPDRKHAMNLAMSINRRLGEDRQQFLQYLQGVE